MGIVEDIQENGRRIDNMMERMLGSTLNIPHAASNSGSRKILANNKKEQAFCLCAPETPILSTGYENKFGDMSSSIIEVPNNSIVLAKISKFSFAPNHHYYIIYQDILTGELDYIERKCYKYKTEVYGYLNNNTQIDAMQVGSRIPAHTIAVKSTGYDEANNKCDGINATTLYISKNHLMEDAAMISDDFAYRGRAPIFHYIERDIPQNIILLNLYGKGDNWKTFPDVGELVEDGTLLGMRLENKENAFFSQSYERLKEIMISDKKCVCNGRVVDIDIICNKPELLEENLYMSQVKAYYDDDIRMKKELTTKLLPYIGQGLKMSYKLEKLYWRSKDVLDGKQYSDDRPLNNLKIKMVVIEEKPIEVGDKIADRHGGKGIVSIVVPKELMPRFNGKPVDICINKSTMYNRENHGQMWELSETYVGDRIVGAIETGVYSLEESIDMILRYLKIVAPEQYQEQSEYINYIQRHDPYSLSWILEMMVRDGHIYIVNKPVTENMDIFKLNALYKEFSWIKQSFVDMPLTDSNGNTRFVKSRRPFVPGVKYMYRLKQYAEEKLSVTPLAATTIKNQNTRSRAAKNYSEPFSDTPIKFGQMESDQFVHMGIEYVITNLMLHSLSPRGRKQVEQMYTGDPFNIDVKLDTESTNVEVEIMNAYLKTMGLRIVFFKKPKKKPLPMMFDTFYFNEEQAPILPFRLVSTDPEVFKPDEYKEYLNAHYELTHNAPFYIEPFKWDPKG